MKNQYTLFIIALLLSISSCNNKQKENTHQEENKRVSIANRKIDTIAVLYYNYLIEPQTPVNPEDIKLNIPQFDKDRKGVLDACINDSARIEKIKNRIDSLKPAQHPTPLDARLVATIKYKDGSKPDRLCLGGQYVNLIYLNGIQQETDNQLIFLLKNYAGFYPWMIGDDMFAMKELQDPSFPIPPFISSPYYEKYQAALAQR